MTNLSPQIRAAAVVIGRNEGARLPTCLNSVLGSVEQLVYVDSGSSDDSVAIARNLGCSVVQLDAQFPFTAARARNEGFRHLQAHCPGITYVQFVDGDCELDCGWITTAVYFLEEHPDIAAVCGRLRERFPEHSIYNRLCDIEWDRPAGEAKTCGGIALMRAEVFAAVGGFRIDIIAGEEPELCVRLRAAGWRIWRLAAEMAWHDAAMMRFSQWWMRSKRAGYSFALGASLHGAPPERHCVREARRSLLWGLLLPAFIVVPSVQNPWLLTLLLIYPAQVIRIAVNSKLKGGMAFWHAVFLMIGRFPEGLGLLSFHMNQLLGKRGALIEYK